MKHIALLAALAAFLIANQSAKAQGALTPPGAPAESQKSLQEIYDAIQSAKAEFATLVQQAVPSVPGMVAVLGGTLPETSELAGEAVSTFYIGKYEVTWNEWQEVRAWAVNQGYDLENVGEGSAGDHPVRNVSWYDVVKWCNAKSEMEERVPMYYINGEVYRTGQAVPSINNSGINLSGMAPGISYSRNGYRLPTEAEWEWAARGGVVSKGYTYSGSNNYDEVAWTYENSNGALVDLYVGTGTWAVGQKLPNELGAYDMTGNVQEWCFTADEANRAVRGGNYGNWSYHCTLGARGVANPTERHVAFGFRLARSYQ